MVVFFKHRLTYAWGYTQWEIQYVVVNDRREFDSYIGDWMHEYATDYSWSDKFRRVEVETEVDTSSDEIQKYIQTAKTDINDRILSLQSTLVELSKCEVTP